MDISVWDKSSWKLKKSLVGHSGSVLVLVYAEDKKWLFSASGDSTVRVSTTTPSSSLSIFNISYIDMVY